MTLLALLLQVVEQITERSTVGFLSSPAGVALIGILGSLLGAWFATRSEIAKAVATARIERETKAGEREETREEKRRQESEEAYRQAKLDEIEGIKDLRESLRQRVKDQDEIIERQDARIRRLEDEAIKTREEREEHGLERLQWFREREEMGLRHRGELEELRRELTEAHRDLMDARSRIAHLESLIDQFESLVGVKFGKDFLAQHSADPPKDDTNEGAA